MRKGIHVAAKEKEGDCKKGNCCKKGGTFLKWGKSEARESCGSGKGRAALLTDPRVVWVLGAAFLTIQAGRVSYVGWETIARVEAGW